MTFIHKYQIKPVEFAGSFVNRLNARDDDRRVFFPTAKPCGINAERQARINTFDRCSGLFQQFLNMCKYENATVPALYRVAANL